MGARARESGVGRLPAFGSSGRDGHALSIGAAAASVRAHPRPGLAFAW